jgi:D-tyrosyl-tRNA(Tyr) deacylase
VRAVIQRVLEANVAVDGRRVGSIGEGLLVLVCVAKGDGLEDAKTLAAKIASIRIFRDSEGKMNRSVVDVAGSVLLVSQFTLCAEVRRGRRPSFAGAAPPERAAELIRAVASAVAEAGVAVSTGAFGERMLVSSVSDGPVTVVVDARGGTLV